MTARQTTYLSLGLIITVLVIAAVVTYRVITNERVSESAAGQAFFGGEGSADRFIATDGTTVDVGTYVGKSKLYINTWASWSPLSRDELIALNEVASEYKDKSVTFIALNRQEPKEMAERYLATLPPLDNLVVVIDSDDYFYSQVGGYAMPETLLYGTDGNLWRHIRQPQTKDSIKTLLDEFLFEDTSN
jgi:thiol-disulfide isomerase/thioredoxin